MIFRDNDQPSLPTFRGHPYGAHLWISLIIHAVACLSSHSHAAEPIVIAHRGASGYLPEHTLPAKALAYGMGADYLEQDVVLSKDGHAIVIHDVHIDRVTNVSQVFPTRHRTDGRYYAIDFTLEELRSLLVTERIKSTGQAVYAKRFPVGKSRFHLHSLRDEIEFIQGLNQATGKRVGIYTEIKQPRWHRDQGQDISRIVLDVLSDCGLSHSNQAVFVQCFDSGELRRIREELQSDLRLVQLCGRNDLTRNGAGSYQLADGTSLQQLATYASGIGPDVHLLRDGGFGAGGQWTPLVQQCHAHGLVVHPYTVRADQLPQGAQSIDMLINMLTQHGVDGFFTDHPDQSRGE